MQFMKCTACRSLVQLNATGICLGCQQGLFKALKEEVYTGETEEVKEEVPNCGIIPQKEYEQIQRLENRKKELEDAIEERKIAENHILQHQRTKRKRKTAKAGDSDSSVPS